MLLFGNAGQWRTQQATVSQTVVKDSLCKETPAHGLGSRVGSHVPAEAFNNMAQDKGQTSVSGAPVWKYSGGPLF